MKTTQRQFWGKPMLLCMLALVGLLPIQLTAQSFYGSIVGTVIDSTGAVIPGATVTIVNLGTNDTHSLASDAAGNFRAVSLVPANYKVTIEADNYKRFVRQPVEVTVGVTSRVDAALQVGSTTETVEVTSMAPLLETESGSLGAQVEGTRVQEMPLNGRNAMNLISLVPGVIPQGSTMGGTGLNNGQGTHTAAASWANYQIGGGIAGQSAQYVDGVTVNVIGGSPVLIPTQDAIQEFRVATNSVSAEFGRFSGGVVEMITKGGTNDWHGSAYEYVRNKVFNANYFFNKTDPTKMKERPKWNQNQFGVLASGPVIKDKLFGLFSWEHFSSRIGVTKSTFVPTANMQNGIITSSNPIVDPSGRCTSIVNNGNGTYTIPQSCWDETSAYMKNLFPPPNANLGAYNFYNVPVMGNNQTQYNGRGDWMVSAKQRLFARYSRWGIDDTTVKTLNGYNGFKSGSVYTVITTYQGVLGDTYTVNPTTILDLRLGYTRFMTLGLPESGTDLNMTQFKGTYAALSPQMSGHVYPAFNVSGHYGIYNAGFSGDSENRYNNYTLSASLMKILGPHTVKFGTELREMDNNNQGVDSASGTFVFDQKIVSDEWAAYLLGIPTTGQINVGAKRGSYDYVQGYYISDTWTVTKKLTLTLGLRWDLPGGLAERKNKATVLLRNANVPVTGQKGTLALVNSDLYRGSTTQQKKHNELQPRIGFAYRLRPSTSLRGGYGLTYLPPDMQGNLDPVKSPVNSASTTFTNVGATSYRTFSNPFPSMLINQPTGRSDANFMQSRLGQNVTGPDPYQPYAYVQQWNLTVGQQMKGDSVVEVGYVGAKGTHLPSLGGGIDELDSKYYADLRTMLASFGSNPTSAQLASLVSTGQALRPYPAYQNLINANPNGGASSYHSLQGRVEKRFKAGGILSGVFTWSKFISDTDTLQGASDPHGTSGSTGGAGVPQDYNNPKGERSIISYDIPRRLVISYVLNLPFGKGHKYMANAGNMVDHLVSGWSVNGITTFQDGSPLVAYSNNTNYLTNSWGGGTLRPKVIANCNKNASGSRYERYLSKQWFNTACFTAPGAIEFGNQPRVDGQLRSQGTDNFDFTISKATTIHEKLNLQYKAEFFNIFNHTQFTPPAGSFGQTSFGSISMQLNQPRLMQLSLRLNY